MPSVVYSKRMFEHYVGKSLPLDELKDRISYLGTDLESIEGDEISVEIFPNRPDLLSIQGFARAFSSFIGHAKGLREYSAVPSGQQVIIEKDAAHARPFTACAIVKGLHFTSERIKEAIDIQEKLHVTYGRNRKKVAIGIYPLEKIAMPITFTAKRPEEIIFTPLEGGRKMDGKEILEHHPTGKAYAHLLEGKKLFPVFLDGKGKVLSLPPIINSEETGRISENTKEVFVECSGFEYPVLEKCLNMIVTALADMGGSIFSMELRYPDATAVSPNLAPSEMPITKEYINKRLGLKLEESDIKELLAKMGMRYDRGKAMVPCYRADILHQIDIAEDIAIAHGFENFEEVIPTVATVAQESSREKLREHLSSLMVGLGFLEASTYHLTDEASQEGKMMATQDLVKLANAISQEYGVLRAWLLPTLMDVLSRSTRYEYPQRLFTSGIVFSHAGKEKGDTGVHEGMRMSAAISAETADYTQVRQIVDYLLRSFSVSLFDFREIEHGSFISGRAAEVLIGKERVAICGEIAPAVLHQWGIGMPAAGMELNVDVLLSAIKAREHKHSNHREQKNQDVRKKRIV